MKAKDLKRFEDAVLWRHKKSGRLYELVEMVINKSYQDSSMVLYREVDGKQKYVRTVADWGNSFEKVYSNKTGEGVKK